MGRCCGCHNFLSCFLGGYCLLIYTRWRKKVNRLLRFFVPEYSVSVYGIRGDEKKGTGMVDAVLPGAWMGRDGAGRKGSAGSEKMGGV